MYLYKYCIVYIYCIRIIISYEYYIHMISHSYFHYYLSSIIQLFFLFIYHTSLLYHHHSCLWLLTNALLRMNFDLRTKQNITLWSSYYQILYILVTIFLYFTLQNKTWKSFFALFRLSVFYSFNLMFLFSNF